MTAAAQVGALGHAVASLSGGRGAPGGGRPDHRPALRRLAALEPDVFAREVWGRGPLLSPGEHLTGEPVLADLFSADAVDELVSTRGLRTPFVRVAKDGTTFADRAFTAGGGVGATIADQVSDDKLLRLFADGATIVLQGLHRIWTPLVELSQALAADLGHPVQVNAYVTPSQSRGFDDHYDVHDVFVLQVHGEKRWRVHEPVHEAPLRDQPWTAHRAAVEAAARTAPTMDVVLHPGDCLYLPRGYLHAATALGGTSIHLTFGVHTWTRHHLADELVRAALGALSDDVDTRRSLPVGACVGDADQIADEVELVRRRLADVLDTVAADVVAARLAERARAAGRAAPVRPLAQLHTAHDLHDLHDGEQPTGRLRLRPYLNAEMRVGTGGRVLRSRAGDLPLNDSDVPAVERLLAAATVADVVTDLDLDLVRRLVLAGVLVPE